MFKRKSFYLTILLMVSGGVMADAGHTHGAKIGSLASASDATRTIEIEMTDNRYNYKHINVRENEIVRFVIHNQGQLVHEFNVGTRKMHAAHQGEMMAMMQSGQMTPTTVMHGHGGMKGHDDPNSVLLNPGESKEFVWKFRAAGTELEFACNVPGHYQAGMAGQFRFKAD